MAQPPPHVEFRFLEESSPDVHRVPAKVLADTLTHAQRAVHLLAMSAAGRTVGLRARIPADVAARFVLECEVSEPGSYVQRVTLGGGGDDLFAEGTVTAVLSRFQQVGAALSRTDWEGVEALVPDAGLRSRVVVEYVEMLPDPEAGWTIEVRNGRGGPARFSPEVVHTLRERFSLTRGPARLAALADPDPLPPGPVTLTGELVGIDFDERRLTIRHRTTRLPTAVRYGDDFEEMLVANRRAIIRVTGQVERDERGHPVRVFDVSDIHPVDLTPIELDELVGTYRRLRFRDGTHTFVPDLDDEGQLLVVHDADLDVHAFAATRDELISEVEEQIEMLWMEYAEADPTTLTEGAASLRRALRERLESLGDES